MEEKETKNELSEELSEEEKFNGPAEPVDEAAAESVELAEILDMPAGSDDVSEAEDEVPVQKPDYKKEIIAIIRGQNSPKIMREELDDYHDNDIADVLQELTPIERRKMYRVLDTEMLSSVFEYAETNEVSEYISEMDVRKAAAIISKMETDTAVSILREIEKIRRVLIIDFLDNDAKKDIALIASFDEDEIGSKMSTNYIVISDGLNVSEAMTELISQAAENDNISTIFVVDSQGLFCGAIDLKELIIARKNHYVKDLVSTSFPYVYGHENIDDVIEKLKDYSENSIPVLDNDNRILGVITSQSIVEVVDAEMGEDYAKFAGLLAEEDLNEPIKESMKKRLPWLLTLMGLSLLISTVVGSFEKVVATLPIVMAFQSLILGMAGNVGTQSLAVTIRVLADENLDFKKKAKLVFKEVRVGLFNGLLMGVISFLFIGLYIYLFKRDYSTIQAFSISGCCGISMVLAMVIAGTTGTLIPLALKKMKLDPAVASGPLITSVNDFVAVIAYYGLSWLLLINMLHLGG